MNKIKQYEIDFAIKNIIFLTKNWDVKTWKQFRSLNNYWQIRDSVYKSKNQINIHLFRLQKIKWIKEFISHFQ